MRQHSTIIVRKNMQRRRYELVHDGTVIGKAHWLDLERKDGPQRVFHHTVVDEAHSGRGLASQLARGALDDAITYCFSIVSVCPFINAWLQRHPAYGSFTMPVLPEHLAAVPRPKVSIICERETP